MHFVTLQPISLLSPSSVHPREPCHLRQVLSWPGNTVPLPDSSVTDQHHHGNAILASHYHQVWQEDSLLLRDVDSPALASVPALC